MVPYDLLSLWNIMNTFAVVKTGGKQYLAEPGKKLKVEKLTAQQGNDFVFDEVLLVAGEKGTTIGAPLVEGAVVSAKVLRHARAKKITNLRYHSKTRYRKKKGHRQHFTEVEIKEIVTARKPE